MAPNDCTFIRVMQLGIDEMMMTLCVAVAVTGCLWPAVSVTRRLTLLVCWVLFQVPPRSRSAPGSLSPRRTMRRLPSNAPRVTCLGGILGLLGGMLGGHPTCTAECHQVMPFGWHALRSSCLHARILQSFRLWCIGINLHARKNSAIDMLASLPDRPHRLYLSDLTNGGEDSSFNYPLCLYELLFCERLLRLFVARNYDRTLVRRHCKPE